MKPFFMDVTLRDGNQALKNPWNLDKKRIIFRELEKIGVGGIEVGFASASDSDFESCKALARESSDYTVISSLSRAVETEIHASWEAVKYAKQPRLHIVLPVSPFVVVNVLKLSTERLIEKAVNSVRYAKKIMDGRGSVQFSGEHFGDCTESLELPDRVFQAVVAEGADVINLPNTVERFRPAVLAAMVKQMKQRLPETVVLSVHNHNDLGMATAATVESFYAGASQLEVSLNGLGERAGNTNLYEVACALYNSGIAVDLDFSRFYSVSRLVEELSCVRMYEKAPLMGEDILSHRSGIHQDGVWKTQNMNKGAYRPIDYGFIGRHESDRLEFTSQSGKGALKAIMEKEGLQCSEEEAKIVQPILKKESETLGRVLKTEEVIRIFQKNIHNLQK